MKNYKSILLFLLVTLFFACQKEDTVIEPGMDVTVTYRLIIQGEAELDEVRFMDENLQLQTVNNPTEDWEYEMIVEEGFLARIELIGTLPENGYHSAMTLIKGTGYGCWGANFRHQVPGDFHIESEYHMGGD